MSCLKTIKYRMVPDQSFEIIYQCGGCGCKTNYKNTQRFRVNANGNKLDVWLIYQCTKCKHTKNLTIYERQNLSKIPRGEYQRFLENDEALAQNIGRDFRFFAKNHVEVDKEAISCHYETEQEKKEVMLQKSDCLLVENPYGLRIRKEKLAAEVLEVSRGHIKRLLETEQIEIRQNGNDTEIIILDSFIFRRKDKVEI